jgi:mRNA degradation ribonuclease J1/J2
MRTVCFFNITKINYFQTNNHTLLLEMEQNRLEKEEVLFVLTNADGNPHHQMTKGASPQHFQASEDQPIVWAVQWPT